MDERVGSEAARRGGVAGVVGSRRLVLRGLVGGALGGAVAAIGPAPEVAASHDEWYLCSKCRGVFYSDRIDLGVCPAGGVHKAGGTIVYLIRHDLPPGPSEETNWRACSLCRGLFFGAELLNGACPASTTGHLRTPTGNYQLEYNQPPSNPVFGGWRYCPKCLGLFRPRKRKRKWNLGVCPAGGKHEIYPGFVYNLE